MTTHIISHPIGGTDVVGHFLSTMKVAGSGIGEQFVKVVADGDFFALVPENQTELRLKQLRTGGLLSSGTVYLRHAHRITEVSRLSEGIAAVVYDNVDIQHAMAFLHEPYLTAEDPSKIARELTNIEFSPIQSYIT